MQSPDDVPMTDAEAEDVLLALAPQLEWRWSKRDRMFKAETLPDRASVMCRCHYSIYVNNEEPPSLYLSRFELSGGRQQSSNSPEYPTEAAAKLACERHYATGKWE